ncbi:hypothetical protein BC831DRAFT_482346 [Entophlyctis helioformis]|nr:hypothetical protein BC831DRAFT_482346 [Entophlyctis helioformis]
MRCAMADQQGHANHSMHPVIHDSSQESHSTKQDLVHAIHHHSSGSRLEQATAGRM